MRKKKSHSSICAGDVFKDLVSFDGDNIILDVSINIDFALSVEKTIKIPLNIR